MDGGREALSLWIIRPARAPRTPGTTKMTRQSSPAMAAAANGIQFGCTGSGLPSVMWSK